MAAITNKKILRVIDANANRAKEGLRVVEDIARFVLSNKKISTTLKKMRHAISAGVLVLSPDYSALLSSRDSEKDVLRGSKNKTEFTRTGLTPLFISNLKRAQEALRVLEETSKLIAPAQAVGFKQMRYSLYTLEKKIILSLDK
ncbi:MAG: thiamine-phosphate pyrophosphorylase [bacterium]